MGKVGLTPNALTLIGFGIAIIAAIVAAAQSWVLAGLLVVFGGVFDLFDGALARATGKASQLGAFMDSVFDRWGEGVIYVGIAWGCVNAGFDLGAVLSAAALASAFMVSYARAKSESLGFTPGHRHGRRRPRAARGPHRDPHGRPDPGRHARRRRAPQNAGSPITLGLITVLATITVIQRILHVLRQPIPEETTVSSNGTQRRRHERPQAGQEDPRRDRRRRQLREQPRPGPLLLRERQGRRVRPGADARQPRRLPHPRHRVRGRVRRRQEQGRQGPVRGDLHEAEQHVRLPAGPEASASRSSGA